MKCNAWTYALLGAGVISLPSITSAEEKPSSLLTSLSSTTISGYVDTSAQWNIGTGNAFVPTYSYGGSSKADGFNLNAVKLSIEKPIEASDHWAAGYKVDTMFGPDANTLATQSTGTAADFALRQAYVALRAPIGNGLDFKMGVWDPIMGYEVTDAPSNPNFTRSYGYTIEPVSHTGLLASYAFTPAISASAGVANTYGPMINQRANPPLAESYKTYMGAFTLTAPESWGSLAGSTLSGSVMNGFNSGVAGNQTSYYIGASVNTPIKELKVGAAYDYQGISQQPLRGSGYANATALYAALKLSEKATFFARGEYASSDLTPNPFGARKVVAVTGTLQYDLWANVLTRLEFRWDHAADGSNAYGSPASEGSSNGPGDKKNSYILMANIAYKF